MALKKCKECGEEISSSVKKCPKCGKDQRNFFMKHPVIYSILIIGVLGVMLGGGESDNTSKTTLSEGTNTVSTEVQNNRKTEYNVGEIFENDFVAVKYVSLDDNFKGYSQYADIKSGHKVIKAEFEFENVSNIDQLVSDWDFTCYADGYDCEEFYYVDDSSFSANLSTGKKTKGSVYFQVPENATEVVIEYETDYWSDSKIEFIVKK